MGMTEPGLNAPPETGAAAVRVGASTIPAARMSTGTAFHAKGRVVGAAETHAMRQAASAASLSARGDRCCGDICVSNDDVCCENVLGNNFPCQGIGGGCCGNACYAPGSKCCKSPWVAKAH